MDMDQESRRIVTASRAVPEENVGIKGGGGEGRSAQRAGGCRVTRDGRRDGEGVERVETHATQAQESEMRQAHDRKKKRGRKVKSKYDTQMGRRAVVEEEDPAPETLLC